MFDFDFSTTSISGRTNQSVQVICRTQNHLVESFGSPLPVLVTEALTFVDRNIAVSVNVSVDGWAWLVHGRKLLVWQCKANIHDPKQRRAFKTQCRELLLPQSDLAHKADCIAVWIPPGHQVFEICICVFLIFKKHDQEMKNFIKRNLENITYVHFYFI